MKRIITSEMINRYCQWLVECEKSSQTITRYRAHLENFYMYIEGKDINKTEVLRWKEQLKNRFAPVSVNASLAAINGLFKFYGWQDLVVRYVKIKKNMFCPEQKELKRQEYERLVHAALETQNERLALLLQTICTTGIRISELKFVTIEAIETKRAVVECKGGIRTVLLPSELCHCLKEYAKRKRITTGMIFITRTGRAMDRSNIWREMKNLSERAKVCAEKIFPHNLRHLFARTYYNQEKDLSRLADILGHCNVNTTKIYTMESGEEHLKQIERLQLVIPEYNKISLLL